MSLLDVVNATSSIAGNSAKERDQYHRVEHARPAVRVTDPADDWALNERSDGAESVDKADDSRGRISAIHFAQLGRKRAA